MLLVDCYRRLKHRGALCRDWETQPKGQTSPVSRRANTLYRRVLFDVHGTQQRRKRNLKTVSAYPPPYQQKPCCFVCNSTVPWWSIYAQYGGPLLITMSVCWKYCDLRAFALHLTQLDTLVTGKLTRIPFFPHNTKTLTDSIDSRLADARTP